MTGTLNEPGARKRRLFAFVIATYNVSRYLPAFLDSLDRQKGGLGDLQLIFVDDGSTDDSAAVIKTWIDGRDVDARVVSKDNGGAASARNVGLDYVTAKWVSFPDPDDEFSTNYLAVVRKFLASSAASRAQLLVTRLMILHEATGELTDTHPLRHKFDQGQRYWELERHPQYLHLQGASAFYRSKVIEDRGARFDERIRPNFEDAAFTTLYLTGFAKPRMTVLPGAQYRYRRREDGSSLVQSSWAKPEKYTVLLEFGWLAMLRTVHEQLGRIPDWVQNVILYDLAFYLRTDSRSDSPTPGLAPEVIDRFHDLLGQVMAYIDTATIEAFKVTWLSRDMRAFLILGVKGERPRPDVVYVDRVDAGRQLTRLRYYFAGSAPVERWQARGYDVDPVHQKSRAVRFFDRDVVSHRTVWLPANGTLSVTLDGRRMPLHIGQQRDPLYGAGPYAMWTSLLNTNPPATEVHENAGPSTPRARIRARKQEWKKEARARLRAARDVDAAQLRTSIETAALPRLARSRPVRSRYRDAWLLMDRDTQAQDNAEHLYRWLRDNRPEVNAWFVLSRTSPDWRRLSDDGFRLIDHGSHQHVLALVNCKHLISSQIDHYVVAPLPTEIYGRPRWRYTFLQHGVTKDDLSPWINPKPISLMLTATPDEHRSIVGDGTPYTLTTHEVSMTGFPRHDRLLELARARADVPRKYVLVTPTWRRELLSPPVGKGNRRQLRQDFWESDYAHNWRRIVESERLSAAAAAAGLDVVFVPHPNMQDYLNDAPLPGHVVVHRFEEIDIQQLVADAAVLVTDYSSIAFEAAYVERPVVYFQFDRSQFFSGRHAYRRGTWSYEDDGFGPVLEEADAVIDAIADILVQGPGPEYAARMQRTFTLRDGRCCERTYEAICALHQPLSERELYLRHDRVSKPEQVTGDEVVLPR